MTNTTKTVEHSSVLKTTRLGGEGRKGNGSGLPCQWRLFATIYCPQTSCCSVGTWIQISCMHNSQNARGARRRGATRPSHKLVSIWSEVHALGKQKVWSAYIRASDHLKCTHLGYEWSGVHTCAWEKLKYYRYRCGITCNWNLGNVITL